MSRSKKWIKGLTPEQPLAEAAQRAIRKRLKAVWDYAPLAAKKPDENIQYVHQLRVATRRARAALEVFADLLPKRKLRRMEKTLRRLRRAAGKARDLDVLGERLASIRKENHDSQLDVVIEQVAARRRRAQTPLVKNYKRAKRDKFKRRKRRLVKAIKWREEAPEPTFAEAARIRLATLVDDFFTAAKSDLDNIKSLHQLRIRGKRLRYAMELFASAFDETFRGDLYATIEEVQEKLGAINDHATAITTLGKWRERDEYEKARVELVELIKLEEHQLQTSRQDFQNWWTADRAADLAQSFANAVRT